MEKTKRRSEEETIAHLTKYLNNDLGEVVGAKLVSIRSANAEEAELLGWELHDFHPIPILEFDNGNALILLDVTSLKAHFNETTGGVCKEQGRIHRAIVTRSY